MICDFAALRRRLEISFVNAFFSGADSLLLKLAANSFANVVVCLVKGECLTKLRHGAETKTDRASVLIKKSSANHDKRASTLIQRCRRGVALILRSDSSRILRLRLPKKRVPCSLWSDA